jgi:aminoglycoside phosphotransferase family enzyme/predicted kinase
MDLAQLIAALSQPAAFPEPTTAVEVCQTHISVVFLTDGLAYKLKKPVRLGFLDFSTLPKRRHFCEEEVRLNRRLAPHVYLGVVPVTRAQGMVGFDGEGEVIDWAVRMRRLPADATLERRLAGRTVGSDALTALARRLAGFHQGADRSAHISEFGQFEVVARNARENFEQAAVHLGTALSAAVFARLSDLTEGALERLRPLIEARAARGVPCDTHGDLHLDHVYLFPERPPPEDLVIVDCIEFNERFRFADPVADVAFLVMDLAYHGRRDLARAFAEAYLRAAGDEEGRALLPFYTAYRAAVRAKVEGFKQAEPEIPPAGRAQALASARAHWLVALGELEEPGERPCLVLVAGLPGSGKSTLARGLQERHGFTIIRSDAVRKELAPALPRTELYAPEWSDQTYAECLRRAEAVLFEGGRVLIDANFREEGRRMLFLDMAARWGVPVLLLVCQVGDEVARARLHARRGDVSDADWPTYLELRSAWEGPGPGTQRLVRLISSDGAAEETLARAERVLSEAGLVGHRPG